MSDKALKGKPIAERLAKMFGETSFRDGLSGRGLSDFSHTDIVSALGFVQKSFGMTVPQAMETHFASTLRHEEALRQAWSERAGEPAQRHDRAVFRFGAALAVRKLAGTRYSTLDHAVYARLLCTRRERVTESIENAERWYNDLLSTGLHEFRLRLGLLEPA